VAGETVELKDLILSTLEELDEKVQEDSYKTPLVAAPLKPERKTRETQSEEKEFLLDSKKRFEVLFEGLKSDENRKVEAKLNLVTNFLQFYLAQIDERLEKI
jgi:nitric oxide reductase activation protein